MTPSSPPPAGPDTRARRRWRRPDATYRASQAARLPPGPPPLAAASLARSLLLAPTLLERERLGSALLATLCDAFGLPPCRLVVADRAQLHARDDQGRLVQRTYGTYRCRLAGGGQPPDRCVVRIYHRTAVRRQVLAAKAFLLTLLHEFVHHLDFCGLRLDRSPHTAGFYARLQQLAAELGAAPPPAPPPEPPAADQVAAATAGRVGGPLMAGAHQPGLGRPAVRGGTAE